MKKNKRVNEGQNIAPENAPFTRESNEDPVIEEPEALKLAANIYTHPKMLTILARHPSLRVQNTVAGNPSLDTNQLLVLAGNPAHTAAAVDNPAFELGLMTRSFEGNPEAYTKAHTAIKNLGRHDIAEKMINAAVTSDNTLYNRYARNNTSPENYQNQLEKGIKSKRKMQENLTINDVLLRVQSMDEGLFTNLKNKLFKSKPKSSPAAPTMPTQHALPMPIKPKIKGAVPSLPATIKPKRDVAHATNIVNQLANITGGGQPAGKLKMPSAVDLLAKNIKVNGSDLSPHAMVNSRLKEKY